MQQLKNLINLKISSNNKEKALLNCILFFKIQFDL